MVEMSDDEMWLYCDPQLYKYMLVLMITDS